MERYDYLLKDERYLSHVEKINKYEKDRIFCHHDMSHFLDVARIAMIINLSENYDIPKDIIYAAALLHDIGRDEQYENGTPHELASADIALKILSDSSYSGEEVQLIIKAIRDHRKDPECDNRDLSDLIYRADKLSRPCFFCPAKEECNWPDNKMNHILKY
ncbi:MAG: HD domain-containing protein [Lachnospiraceae bacterium]|nr:HD domain-containing protein [Lachnospiraceae bacterium]